MAQRLGQILAPRNLRIGRHRQHRTVGVHHQQRRIAKQINLVFARYRIALRQGFKIGEQIQRVFGFHPRIGGIGKEVAVIGIAFGRHPPHQRIQELIIAPGSDPRRRISGDVGRINLAQPVFKHPAPGQQLHVIFNRMAGGTACGVINHLAPHRIGGKGV